MNKFKFGVVNLISSTTSNTGLKVKCVVDDNVYQTGIHVSDEEFAKVNMETTGPNTAWNYIIYGLK